MKPFIGGRTQSTFESLPPPFLRSIPSKSLDITSFSPQAGHCIFGSVTLCTGSRQQAQVLSASQDRPARETSANPSQSSSENTGCSAGELDVRKRTRDDLPYPVCVPWHIRKRKKKKALTGTLSFGLSFNTARPDILPDCIFLNTSVCRGMVTCENSRSSGTTSFLEQALKAQDPETGARFTKRQLIMEALVLALAGK